MELVSTAESIASIVSEPNIIAITNHLKSGRYVRIMKNPGSGTAENAMLKKHNGSTGLYIVRACYSIHGKDISIQCLYMILLVVEAGVLHYFLKGLVVLGWELLWPIAWCAPVNGTVAELTNFLLKL